MEKGFLVGSDNFLVSNGVRYTIFNTFAPHKKMKMNLKPFRLCN
jgi:hypothetical protein